MYIFEWRQWKGTLSSSKNSSREIITEQRLTDMMSAQEYKGLTTCCHPGTQSTFCWRWKSKLLGAGGVTAGRLHPRYDCLNIGAGHSHRQSSIVIWSATNTGQGGPLDSSAGRRVLNILRAHYLDLGFHLILRPLRLKEEASITFIEIQYRNTPTELLHHSHTEI